MFGLMYIHLKHSLADAALITIQYPRRAALAAWLAAYVDLSGDGAFEVPLARVMDATRERAAACRLALPRGLLVEIRDLDLFTPLHPGGTVALRPEFRPHAAYMRRQVDRLWRTVVRLRQDVTLRALPRDVRLGVLLFDAGLYFECHEYLEGVWKRASQKDKGFYHGFVQVGAAFYHYEKSNMHGARTLLSKGLDKLARYAPAYQGVDVAEFCVGLQPWLDFFAGAGARPAVEPMVPVISTAKRATRQK